MLAAVFLASAAISAADGSSTSTTATATIALTPTSSVSTEEIPVEDPTKLDLGRTEEDREDLLALLNAPVVTAAGFEEEAALAPANVVSVTAEQIAQHGWRSLSEVLANTLGLYVIDDHVQPSIGVRGITGGPRAGTRVVKIMINAVPVTFRPDLTAFLGTEYIPIEAVARIEIAKGPLSALYGANAFLATVNVITKSPPSGVYSEAAGRVNVVESNSGFGVSTLVSYAGEGRSLLLAFSHDQQDRSGLKIQRTFPGQNDILPIYRRYFSGASVNDISLRSSGFGELVLDLETYGTLTVQGGVQELDANGEFQLNSVLTHRNRHALRNYWSYARHEKWWTEDLKITTGLGLATGAPTRNEILFLTGSNDFAFKRHFDYRAVDGSLDVSYGGFDNFLLKGGLDLSFEDHHVLYYTRIFNVQSGPRRPGEAVDLISEGDVTTVDIYNFGAFVQASGAPIRDLPDLRLSGNLRLDDPSLFPIQYSWRIAAAYRWSEGVVTKLIVGRAFQAPSPVLMFGLPGFGFQNNIVGSETLPGMSDLRVQVLHSAELVVSMELLDAIAVEAAVYGQRIDDSIEFVQRSKNFVPRNLSARQIVGAELVARARLGPFDPYLSVAGQLCQVDGVDAGLSAEPPPNYPSVVGVAGVSARLPEYHLAANAQARFVGSRGASQSNVLLNNEQLYTLKPYAVVDATISTIDLRFFGDGLETKLVLSAQNLLDRRYSDPGFGGIDIPALGRTIFLELRQTLK